MLYKRRAHADLVVVEIKQTTICCDPSGTADPDIHLEAGKEIMRFTSNDIAIRVTHPPTRNGQLAMAAMAQSHCHVEIVRHHAQAFVAGKRKGTLFRRGSNAKEKRCSLRNACGDTACNQALGFEVHGPPRGIGQILITQQNINTTVQTATQPVFTENIDVAADRLRSDTKTHRKRLNGLISFRQNLPMDDAATHITTTVASRLVRNVRIRFHMNILDTESYGLVTFI